MTQIISLNSFKILEIFCAIFYDELHVKVPDSLNYLLETDFMIKRNPA